MNVNILFGTPIIVSELPEATALNAALSATILEREKSHPGTQHSNLGGWQSDWEMDRWGGASAIKLLAVGRNTANRITTDRQGKPVSIAWKANMWANVNRTGHANEFHSHPGSFWSAVYYVDDGGIDADPSLGGELEFMDPRGPGPAMYAPHHRPRWSWRVVLPPTSICAAAWKTSPASTARVWSPRRSSSAPTTAP